MGKLEKPTVDLRRLRYFLAVCDHGGFSRAAVAIGVAQPALTRQIQLLEQELGVELVTRNGRSALPTEAGQALLRKMRPHLDGLDQSVSFIRDAFADAPARVSLGICPTIIPLFLDRLTESLRQSGSNIELKVIEAYSGDLRNLMTSGGLDLAISYLPTDDPSQPAVKLLTERLVLVTAGLPDAAPGTVSLAQALNERLILPSTIHQLRRIIATAARARGLDLSPALELDSLNAVKAMLETTKGGLSTILPYHAVREDAERGRFQLRLIEDPAMVRTIALLHPDEATRALPVGLMNQIVACAGDLRASLEAVT